MRKNLFALFLVLGLVHPAFSWGAERATRAQSSGPQTFRDRGKTAELRVGLPGKGVRLKMNRPFDESQNSVQVTLFDKNQKPFTLELRAMTPPNSTTSIFSGSLSVKQESFVGAEIRIPLQKGDVEVLKLDR